MEWRELILARFDDLQAAAVALARQLVQSMQKGLDERDAATIAVPGGSTPLPLFEQLRHAPVDWSKVAITLTDERWVPESSPASNAALVRNALRGSAAEAALFVPLYSDAPSATAGLPAARQALQRFARPFDAVVLGMGDDGHFASLFPGNAGLAAALDPGAQPDCVAMRAPVEPVDRISLNLAALLDTRRLFLLISGKQKEELLMQAARREGGGEWPVSSLLAQRQPLPEVYWAP
jgi:6-phosphogluconolactonase